MNMEGKRSLQSNRDVNIARNQAWVSHATAKLNRLAVHDMRRHGMYGSAAFEIHQGTMQPQTSSFNKESSSQSSIEAVDSLQGHDTRADHTGSLPRLPVHRQGNQHHSQHIHEQTLISSLTTTTDVPKNPNQTTDVQQPLQNQIAERTIFGLSQFPSFRTQVLLPSQALDFAASQFRIASRPVPSTTNRLSGPNTDSRIQDSKPATTFPRPLCNQSMSSLRPNTEQQGIDIGRDDKGKVLPDNIQPAILSDAKTRSIRQASSLIPTMLMEGFRGLKRKHGCVNNSVLPPEAFIWRGSSDPNFTAFNGFLLYPELCFLLASHLRTRDLISLYAICRDFHTILNSRFTTVCMTIVREKAPESAKAFHYRSYRQYCRDNPAYRPFHTHSELAGQSVPHMIPSLRWVQFVLFREKVVHELMAVLHEVGLPLPPNSSRALKRMWYLMDIPDNPRRIGAIHNERLVSNSDLYLMFAFMVKLDMLCNDPLGAEKQDGLRKLMLSQEDGLLTVLLVAKRLKWKRRADLLVAWIKNSCEIAGAQDPNFDPVSFGASTIFGVPIRQAGLGKYEYWGKLGTVRRVHPITGAKQHWQVLLRPDQLVMREAIRRGLRFKTQMLRQILYGYIDPDNLESYFPQPIPRRIPEWHDEEYEVDSLVGGVQALSVGQGGDPLLDLGPTREDTGSHMMATEDSREQMTKNHLVAGRRYDEHFLKLCQIWALREAGKIGSDDPIRHDELMQMPDHFG